MWMPSNRHSLLAGQPLPDANVEGLALDWETIGRAIRECVLDALELKAAEISASGDDVKANKRTDRWIERE